MNTQWRDEAYAEGYKAGQDDMRFRVIELLTAIAGDYSLRKVGFLVEKLPTEEAPGEK